jgi:hypothetical protein
MPGLVPDRVSRFSSFVLQSTSQTVKNPGDGEANAAHGFVGLHKSETTHRIG